MQNPEARGGTKRNGDLCYMRAKMTTSGLSGTKWENIAKRLVIPGAQPERIKGVFRVPANVESLTICGEVESAGAHCLLCIYLYAL